MDYPNCSPTISSDDPPRSMPSSSTVKANKISWLIWTSDWNSFSEKCRSHSAAAVDLGVGHLGCLTDLQPQTKLILWLLNLFMYSKKSAISFFVDERSCINGQLAQDPLVGRESPVVELHVLHHAGFSDQHLHLLYANDLAGEALCGGAGFC